MSEPEQQDHGGPDEEDVLGRPYPFPSGDWAETAGRLEELYERAERQARELVRWYLAARTGKRRAARALRGGTVAGVAGGAALLLLELAGALGAEAAVWGFLALLGAAACRGCDRFLGATSGWMRDVAAAQAVQRRLEALRFEWAAESARAALGAAGRPADGPAGGRAEGRGDVRGGCWEERRGEGLPCAGAGTAAAAAAESAERRLTVLRRFSEDLTELVRAETAEWMAEFRPPARPAVHGSGAGTRSAPGSLPDSAPDPAPGSLPAAPERNGCRGEPPRDGLVPRPACFPQQPGARPFLPHQRPPEPPSR